MKAKSPAFKKRWNYIKVILMWMVGLILLIAMFLHKIDNPVIKALNNPWVLFSVGAVYTDIIGFKYFKLLYYELFKWKRFGMNAIIVLSTQVSFWYSLYQCIVGQSLIVVEASIFTILFLETGDIVRELMQGKAASDLKNLYALQPKFAHVLRENAVLDVKIKQIQKGETIIVKTNEIIPIDSILLTASGGIDTQIIDGEMLEKHYAKGDTLFSGMVNKGQDLQMKTIADSKNSLLSKMVAQIAKIQTDKSALQTKIDKIVIWFAPLLLILAVAGFLISYFVSNQNNIAKAIEVMITVLVAACPCALGIAIPMAIVIGSAKAAKQGIIFNSPEAFQRLGKIKYLAFDKTGTLTKGQVGVHSYTGSTAVLPYVLAIEELEIHPIATGIKKYLLSQGVEKYAGTLKNVAPLTYQTADQTIKLLNQKNLSPNLEWEIKKEDNDFIETYVVVNDKVVGLFKMADEIRENAKEIIQNIKQHHITPVMITGDKKVNALKVAHELGIEAVYYEKTAAEKLDIVKTLQSKNNNVAFVGDGVNDILAIQQANLSIAILSPSAFVQLGSDMTLLNPDISLIDKSINVAKLTTKIIYTNLFWAFLYNMVVIPLAIATIITPLIGMATMFASSILVLLNSLAFKMKKI
jgi:Cu+-exporting ATPase